MTLYKEKEVEIRAKYEPIIEALIDNTAQYEQEAIMVTSEIFGRRCEEDETFYEKLTEAQKTMVND